MKPSPVVSLSFAALAALGTLAVTSTACGGRHEAAAPPTLAPIRAALGSADKVTLPNETELAARVEAERSAAVSSRVMAAVTAVHVRLGDRVGRGQLLVSIDPTAAEGQASQAEGALAQAKAALVLAERNFQRFSELAKSASASDLELDVARTQYEQAKGAVAQAEGAVAAARSVARESKVVAPFAGRVTARMVEAGDLAAPGRPLVMIESEGGRRMAFEVPERLAAAAGIRTGEVVAVAIDARPDLGRLDGAVVEAAPGPDPMTHSQLVKVELPATVSGEVAAGASGRAYVVAGERQAVVAPAAALIANGGLELVVVRGDDGRSATRVVTRGRTLADGRVEVLSGLAGGESLALGLASAPAGGTPIEPGDASGETAP